MSAYIELSTGWTRYSVEDLFKEKLDMVKCTFIGADEPVVFFKIELKEDNNAANLAAWVKVFKPSLERGFAGWEIKFSRLSNSDEEVSNDLIGMKYTEVKICPISGESYFLEGGNKAVTPEFLASLGEKVIVKFGVSQPGTVGMEYYEMHKSYWDGGSEPTWTKFRVTEKAFG